jgi:hypothetical protein
MDNFRNLVQSTYHTGIPFVLPDDRCPIAAHAPLVDHHFGHEEGVLTTKNKTLRTAVVTTTMTDSAGNILQWSKHHAADQASDVKNSSDGAKTAL